MMRRRLSLAAATVLGALALSSCSSTSPAVERREALNDIVTAANSGDAADLRDAVDRFTAIVSRQSGTDLEAAEVQRLIQDAARVRAASGVIDQDLLDRQRLQQEASASASVAQSAMAEAERLKQLEEERIAASASASAAAASESAAAEASASASASSTPSASPTPDPGLTLDPGAPVEPGDVVGE